MMFLYFVCFIVSFAVLFKCSFFFVEGACGIAKVLNVSKMIIGIALVSLATTAPEFGVSVIAAFRGHPEIALGNAIGSVICDDGVALALAALLAPAVILVNCRILRTVGIFLLGIDALVYLLARNGVIGRIEGLGFITLLCIYYIFIIKKREFPFRGEIQNPNKLKEEQKASSDEKKAQLRKAACLFAGGIIGVALASLLIVWSAVHIAEYFSISETIIGLTVIAIGTSLPEITTCVTAALKGEGEIAVGNIIGADILNVLWIVGASSIVNPIQVELDVINFTFPFMILIVTFMLVAMRIRCQLGKMKGVLLFLLYLLYLFLTLKLFT